MQKIKQTQVILATLLITILLWNCKEEEDPVIPYAEPKPEGEITLPNNATEFNFGDTIDIEARAIKNETYCNRLILSLGTQTLIDANTKDTTYQLKTAELETGMHTITLVVKNSQDSTHTTTQDFTLVAVTPIIETTELLHGADTAQIKGQLLSTGGEDATWGICYNTTGSPVSTENAISTTEEEFAISLSQLAPLTTYYVRTWATNSKGTTYGDEVEFTTTGEVGTFTDFRDDKVYRYVVIGTQTWMAENLAYIPFLTDPTVDPVLDSNIYVYGYMGTDINEAKQTDNYHTYGALYSWRMANKYCPTGWHLPDTNEWNTLIDYLGGEEVAGGKMKVTGTEYWNSPNEGATNESGFTVIGGGSYHPSWGGFSSMGEEAIFWQSNSYDSDGASVYTILNRLAKCDLSPPNSKKLGNSVRCIKD